jgi:hypothetical protein
MRELDEDGAGGTPAPHAAVSAGDMITYRGRRRFLARRVGAAQVLGFDARRPIVFVRVFDASGDELRPFIEFLPITQQAFLASAPKAVRRMPLPAGWEALLDEWDQQWRAGAAGAFSVPLLEVTEKTLETVDHLRHFSPDAGAFIQLAYPKRSSSGLFDSIVAHVQTDST